MKHRVKEKMKLLRTKENRCVDNKELTIIERVLCFNNNVLFISAVAKKENE